MITDKHLGSYESQAQLAFESHMTLCSVLSQTKYIIRHYKRSIILLPSLRQLTLPADTQVTSKLFFGSLAWHQMRALCELYSQNLHLYREVRNVCTVLQHIPVVSQSKLTD